jgi:5-methyltetrahydrofolate--homocysteine methyltransferase
VPEQSTLALVAHHPQAFYFGMKQGRLHANGTPDDVIKGSRRDPSLFDQIPPDSEDEAAEEMREAVEAG